MFGKLARLAKSAVKVAGKIAPLAKFVGKQIPGIGLGIVAAEMIGGGLNLASKLGGGGGGGAMPQLPMLPAPGAMAATAGGGMGPMDAFAMQAAATGRRGSVAMPPMTMEMIQQLQAAGLMTGFKDLRVFRRSPRKDHVVVHPVGADGGVATFALHKKLARTWGLWSPSAKPPISAGDWNAIRRANAVVKKLKGMNSDVRKVSNFGQRASAPRLRVMEIPGRKLIARKAA